MSEQHREIREGDEIYCVTCGKRWDIYETPPPCVSLTRHQRGLNQINKLRKQYGFKNQLS